MLHFILSYPASGVITKDCVILGRWRGWQRAWPGNMGKTGQEGIRLTMAKDNECLAPLGLCEAPEEMCQKEAGRNRSFRRKAESTEAGSLLACRAPWAAMPEC